MMSWDIDKYAGAWEFATISHMGQTYGGRYEGQQIPYATHLASVAAEVMWGIQEEIELDVDLAIQCALLHDVIEDTEISFTYIGELFGDAVANGVMALTKNKSIASRSEQMIDSLQRIKKQSKEIWIVKLADRITNLYHPPFYWGAEKIEAYKCESRLILEELGSANNKLSARLASKISDYNV